MTESVRYIRLINGEEVIGLVSDEVDASVPQLIRVTDPLVIESYSSEDNPMQRMVYMTRYAPFAAENVVTFHRDAVVTHGPVTAVVARYYEISREYCRQKTDKAFATGIEETIAHVDDILSQEERPARKSSDVRSIADAITLAALATFSSNTVN